MLGVVVMVVMVIVIVVGNKYCLLSLNSVTVHE